MAHALPTNPHVSSALAGRVVISLGQLTDGDRRALDREVKRGRLEKWRGHWFPVSGASFGIGPLKLCWGLPGMRAAVQS